MAVSHPHLALFPHGLSAGAKLLIYLVISIILLTLDSHYRALDRVRGGFNLLLVPVEQGVQAPWLAWRTMDAFFVRHAELVQENHALRTQSIAWNLERQHNRQLEQENRTLRALLGLRARLMLPSTSAEIIGIPRDPWRRLFTVDAGSMQGIQGGSAVIDAQGLLGQVTRVYPAASEITLLTDKEQAVPITIARTGQHAILFGTGSDDYLELRYLPHSADIRNGDLLVTSGLDGLYPPGLAVARIQHVNAEADQEFDTVICRPVAAIDRNRQVLIIHHTPVH